MCPTMIAARGPAQAPQGDSSHTRWLAPAALLSRALRQYAPMTDRPDPLTPHEARSRARRLLPPEVWRYLETRADGSMRDRNAAAWRGLELRPRILRSVAEIDTATEVLGRPITSPMLMAPNGRATRFHPEGELAVMAGAARAGIGATLASSAHHALDATALRPPVVWVQIYPSGDVARDAERAVQAQARGAHAVVVTVDLVPRPGAAAPALTAMSWEAGRTSTPGTPAFAAASLDDIARLAERSPLPIVVKGVMRGDDADACMRSGAQGIVVSNHGDGQLIGASPTAHVLPEVVAAVAGRAEVYVDGGLRDGSAILMALALGARAVLIGRPVSHALACGGAIGVEALFEGLNRDLERCMALCGAARLSDLRPDLIRQR